jgi:type IV secretion system protein VirB10
MSDNERDLAQVQSSAPSDDVAPRAPRKEPAEQLALHANPRPVTRLNRTTLLVLIGGLAVAIFASALWGLRRPSNGGVPAEQPRNVEHISRG